MKSKVFSLTALGLISGTILLLSACAGPAGAVGPAGPGDQPGRAGPQGASASVPGMDTGANVTLELSRPGNGTYLAAGEKMVVTITLNDKFGAPLAKSDFATLALYADGPQETTKTVSAVKLLNATTDRTKTPHHYIDLLTNTDAQVKGNVITYTFQPVSDEEPGTYTVALREVKKGTPPVNQAFVLADFQLGTATVEKKIVEAVKCAACHLGTQNGQFYMHHVDVSARSPYGSPSIDTAPIGTCKVCHNNNGYASYVDPANKDNRINDQIVKRVHGVHFGEELKNPANNDPSTGLYKNYLGVVFPADVRNCTACHIDDRWKTQPSVLACGACHDNVWFGELAKMPKGNVAHSGGAQANDATCAACHPADKGGLAAIAEVHDPKVNIEHDDVVLTMSPPRNGKFFVAGERPVVTIVMKDASGKPIDHTKVVSPTFAAANLYVYGPRANAKPVLTMAAKNGNSKAFASATSSVPASQQSDTDNVTKGWTFTAGDTFKIALHGGPVQELAAPTGVQTGAQVVAWLSTNLKDVTVSLNAAGNVNILSKIAGDKSRIEIYNSVVTTKMGWKPSGLDIIEHGQVVGKTVGTTVEPFVIIGNVSTASNDLRSTTDPLITKTYNNIAYQLDDVAGLAPGTYMAYSYANTAGVLTKNGWIRSAFGLVTFQVGTDKPEPKIAENCAQCHGNTVMHLNESNVHPELFDTDYCVACHDYNRSGTGESFSRVGGSSTSGWSGYGAKPIGPRVHGVHRGAYLEHKEDVYAGNPNMASEIIFPQDIRNCTVCHDKGTSGTWQSKPGRLACMACHDNDSAKSHAVVMTSNPTPADPYNLNRIETCQTCHGIGKDFSVEKAHNISNPYKPPYPREGE